MFKNKREPQKWDCFQAIQIILDGIKVMQHKIYYKQGKNSYCLVAYTVNVNVRKCKEMVKLAENTESHLFAKELENSLKKDQT